MCSASSLKFIETNWDGMPDKVLATCLPNCSFHLALLHLIEVKIKVKIEVFEKKVSLDHVCAAPWDGTPDKVLNARPLAC